MNGLGFSVSWLGFSYRISTRGHRVFVGCARGKLTLTKTEKSRPQPMSTGCRQGPVSCEAAPGRSTDMPDATVFNPFTKYFFLEKFIK